MASSFARLNLDCIRTLILIWQLDSQRAGEMFWIFPFSWQKSKNTARMKATYSNLHKKTRRPHKLVAAAATITNGHFLYAFRLGSIASSNKGQNGHLNLATLLKFECIPKWSAVRTCSHSYKHGMHLLPEERERVSLSSNSWMTFSISTALVEVRTRLNAHATQTFWHKKGYLDLRGRRRTVNFWRYKSAISQINWHLTMKDT